MTAFWYWIDQVPGVTFMRLSAAEATMPFWEVGERIEAIGAVRALDEGVVDVELSSSRARLDDVGVEVVGRRQFVLIRACP